MRKTQKGGVRIQLAEEGDIIKHVSKMAPKKEQPNKLEFAQTDAQKSCYGDCALVALKVMFGPTKVIDEAIKKYLTGPMVGCYQPMLELIIKMILLELDLKKFGLWQDEGPIFYYDLSDPEKVKKAVEQLYPLLEKYKLNVGGQLAYVNTPNDSYDDDKPQGWCPPYEPGQCLISNKYAVVQFSIFSSIVEESIIQNLKQNLKQNPKTDDSSSDDGENKVQIKKAETIIERIYANLDAVIEVNQMALLTINSTSSGEAHTTIVTKISEGSTAELFILEEQECHEGPTDVITLKEWLAEGIYGIPIGQDLELHFNTRIGKWGDQGRLKEKKENNESMKLTGTNIYLVNVWDNGARLILEEPVACWLDRSGTAACENCKKYPCICKHGERKKIKRKQRKTRRKFKKKRTKKRRKKRTKKSKKKRRRK